MRQATDLAQSNSRCARGRKHDIYADLPFSEVSSQLGRRERSTDQNASRRRHDEYTAQRPPYERARCRCRQIPATRADDTHCKKESSTGPARDVLALIFVLYLRRYRIAGDDPDGDDFGPKHQL